MSSPNEEDEDLDVQLRGIGLPRPLFSRLKEKLRQQTFDAGQNFHFVKQRLVLSKDLAAGEDVFLVDHAFTYSGDVDSSFLDALLLDPSAGPIANRLFELLEIPPPLAAAPTSPALRDMFSLRLKSVSCPYPTYDSASPTSFFVMDEVGSRLAEPSHSAPASFTSSLLLDPSTGQCFTVFWPIRFCPAGTVASCLGLTHPLSRSSSLSLALSGAPSSSLSQLSPLFRSWGYNVETINALIGLDPYSGVLPVWSPSFPSLHSRLGEPPYSGLPLLVSAFMFGQAFPLRSLLECLSSDAAQQQALANILISGGFLRRLECKAGVDEIDVNCSSDDLYASLVSLTPVSLPSSPSSPVILLATDFFSTAGLLSALSSFDPVMYLGPDTVALVGLLSASPPTPIEAGDSPVVILDLCSGSGVQGISALLLSDPPLLSHPSGCISFFVDLNPRAIRFSKVNLAINGVPDIEPELLTASPTLPVRGGAAFFGDACSPLTAFPPVVVPYLQSPSLVGRSSLILANPPYVASGVIPSSTARALEVFGDGGPRGEDVTHRLVRCGAELLSPARGSCFRLVANLADASQSAVYGETVKLWTGEESTRNGRSWTVLHGSEWGPKEYARLVLNANDKDDGLAVRTYAEGLVAAEVKGMSNGFIVARGGEAGEGGVQVIMEHEEIWRVVARSDDEGRRTREKIGKIL